jgi:histone H2B
MSKVPNYKTYIFKVLMQVHPDSGITARSMYTVNEIVKSLVVDITKYASNLAISANKKTITSREIQAAVLLLLPEQLKKHGISEGTKAVTKYNAKFSASYEGSPESKAQTAPRGTAIVGKAKKAPRVGHTSMAARAGLTFSPSRIRALMRLYATVDRIGSGGPVYLAAVMEYLIGYILELAGNKSSSEKHIRITNRDILLSMSSDDQLAQLLGPKNYVLGGGVVPTIKVKSDSNAN